MNDDDDNDDDGDDDNIGCVVIINGTVADTSAFDINLGRMTML